LIRATLNGHAVLLHGFEQRRLRLWRRPVDLVGQDDVAEDGAGSEDHQSPPGRRLLLNQVGPGDVGRHQVWRELNSRELQVEDARERLNQKRLGQTGNADDQAVAADEQRQEHEVDDVVLADYQLSEFVDDLLSAGVHPVGERDIVGRFEINGLYLTR